ncbi:MAG: hypothetical protein HRU12_23265 [Phaeodactylibacter sp.]|nr:hypothetical protein [Phaeodactylibacter sp.]
MVVSILILVTHYIIHRTSAAVLGAYIDPIQRIEPEHLNTTLVVLDRAYNISRASITQYKFERCDLLIAAESLEQYSIFNMQHIDDFYQMGYDTTIKLLKENPL